jgi:hypothetical protein
VSRPFRSILSVNKDVGQQSVGDASMVAGADTGAGAQATAAARACETEKRCQEEGKELSYVLNVGFSAAK